MKKVMGFNFQTIQYEQASEAEGKEFLGLIESMNADCAAQQYVPPTAFGVDMRARFAHWLIALGKSIIQNGSG